VTPQEIKPDTQLCTILGYNAQAGYVRKYFNKILKNQQINATAIALNITDDYFDFTMANVTKSKIEKMIIEREFQTKILRYCDTLDATATQLQRVDFVEIIEGKICGFCLDETLKALFDKPEYIDERIALATKMMLIANRWHNATIDIDEIPFLIGE